MLYHLCYSPKYNNRVKFWFLSLRETWNIFFFLPLSMDIYHFIVIIPCQSLLQKSRGNSMSKQPAFLKRVTTKYSDFLQIFIAPSSWWDVYKFKFHLNMLFHSEVMPFELLGVSRKFWHKAWPFQVWPSSKAYNTSPIQDIT